MLIVEVDPKYIPNSALAIFSNSEYTCKVRSGLVFVPYPHFDADHYTVRKEEGGGKERAETYREK